MHFNFSKYQGTGNDFVIINNINQQFPKQNISIIKQLCDRKFGIGADGLMLLEQTEGYDFKMVYFNADGNESTMCGNGGRCISAFAHTQGISKNKGVFMAIDGEHYYEIEQDTVRLNMIDVAEIKHDIENGNENFILFTGSPHYVSFKQNIAALDILPSAHAIRYNTVFAKEGINVNFVETQMGKIKMRTYERGVEDETLSCGTGTVAVALCFAHQNNLEKGKIEIETPGGNLAVSFQLKNNVYSDIWLEGPAKLVFTGSIDI